MTGFLCMVSPRGFILIREDVLKLELCKNCAACMESRNPEAPLTIPKEMVSVNDSTAHFMLCYIPFLLRRRESGPSTSRDCVMHITQPHIPLLDIPHTTSCLVLIQNCQLISCFQMTLKTNHATMVSGFLSIKTVYVKLTYKHKPSLELKLSSGNNSLIAASMLSLTKFKLEREFSLVTTLKEEQRFKTDGILRSTKW